MHPISVLDLTRNEVDGGVVTGQLFYDPRVELPQHPVQLIPPTKKKTKAGGGGGGWGGKKV